MLCVAILTWGSDLLIRPAESIQYVKDMKNRLHLDDVDFIIFDSGYFIPIAFDNFLHEVPEELQVELFGNPIRRGPAWE